MRTPQLDDRRLLTVASARQPDPPRRCLRMPVALTEICVSRFSRDADFESRHERVVRHKLTAHDNSCVQGDVKAAAERY